MDVRYLTYKYREGFKYPLRIKGYTTIDHYPENSPLAQYFSLYSIEQWRDREVVYSGIGLFPGVVFDLNDRTIKTWSVEGFDTLYVKTTNSAS